MKLINNIKHFLLYLFFAFSFSMVLSSSSFAQTDLYISGPDSGFPVGMLQFCSVNSDGKYTNEISKTLKSNLVSSGMYRIIEGGIGAKPKVGPCKKPGLKEFKEWSEKGAEGLLHGIVEVKELDDFDEQIQVDFYLYDTKKRKAVMGKRYVGNSYDRSKLAHKFSNAILEHFTGVEGVFGSLIAFIKKTDEVSELFLMDNDGTHEIKATKDKKVAAHPSWAPDGKFVLFSSNRGKSTSMDLFAYDVQKRDHMRLTKLGGDELNAHISPDEKEILTTIHMGGKPKMAVFSLTGNFKDVLSRPNTEDTTPAWGKRGQYIVFSSNSKEVGRQIYVMHREIGKVSRVSYTKSKNCFDPKWSPVEDKIIFVCDYNGYQIFLADLSGSEAVQLTFRGDNLDPDWAPDGRSFVYSSDFGITGSPMNLGIFSLVSLSSHQITNSTKADYIQPAWSSKVWK